MGPLILAVIGATGNQGGSVVDYVLNDPTLSQKFRIRALTRDLSQPAAQTLKERGIEVMRADLTDAGSLRAAFHEVHSVYGFTGQMLEVGASGQMSEFQQGKALADAAVAAGVKYLIWSTLPSVSQISGGKFQHVQHFDAKAEVEQYIRSLSIKSAFFEISDHRQKLMHIYNRYIEVSKSSVSLSSPGFGTEELEDMAWNALFHGVWEGAYLLSQHVFSPSPETQSPIHPLGVAVKWTAADADLSSAMLISLSASSKTARSFAYHLSNRPASAGPLGLLQVTSSPLPISVAAENLQPPYPTRTIAYSEICESLEWVAGLKAFKIVIVDFGARDNILYQLVESIKNHPVLRSCTLAIIQVGSQQKVYTDEDVLATEEEMSRFGKVQYNTSGVQDTVMQLNGAATYFDTVTQLWDQWLRNRHRSIPDMRIVWGKGISGVDGIGGGWQRLCQGLVGGEEGLVYRFY